MIPATDTGNPRSSVTMTFDAEGDVMSGAGSSLRLARLADHARNLARPTSGVRLAHALAEALPCANRLALSCWSGLDGRPARGPAPLGTGCFIEAGELPSDELFRRKAHYHGVGGWIPLPPSRTR